MLRTRPKAFLPVWLTFILALLPSRASAEAVQLIWSQVVTAHGGLVSINLIVDAVLTGQISVLRGGVLQNFSVTIKTRDKLMRTEYTDERGSVVFVKNGTIVWERRGQQIEEHRNPAAALQEMYLNPSIGLLRTIPIDGTGLTDDGLITIEGQEYRRLALTYTPLQDRWILYGRESEKMDIYIDPTTLLVAQLDYTKGIDRTRLSFRYKDYRTINGIAVPGTVSRFVDSVKVWEVRADTVRFNQNLSPNEFLQP